MYFDIDIVIETSSARLGFEPGSYGTNSSCAFAIFIFFVTDVAFTNSMFFSELFNHFYSVESDNIDCYVFYQLFIYTLFQMCFLLYLYVMHVH